jgi:choline dehydrogenase-like flavoprotein
MRATFDIAVIGSGFAGSLIAMIARRLGRSVILIERGKHPRFTIGESSTPLANLLLEEIARALRSASASASDQMGKLAAHLSRDRLRLETRVYFLSPYIRAAVRRRCRSAGINSWSARARRTRSPIRIGTGRILITFWWREAQSIGVEYFDSAG